MAKQPRKRTPNPTAAEPVNPSAVSVESAPEPDSIDSGDDTGLDADFDGPDTGTEHGDDSDAITDRNTVDVAEPVPVRAPSARAESSRAVARPAARKADRVPICTPRESSEDIFDWLERPDVREHVKCVVLRRKLFDEGGNVREAPSQTFAGAPPRDYVFSMLPKAGVYNVRVLRKGVGDQQIILGGDPNYFIDDDAFEEAKRNQTERQTPPAPAATLAVPANDVDWMRQQLARREEELRLERAARIDSAQQLAKLSATVEALKVQGQQAKPNDSLELFRAVQPLLAGPKMELQQLDQIRQAAYAEGREAGKIEGKLAARVDAMAEAQRTLTSEAQRLAEYRAALIRERQNLDADRAELNDRTADVAELERDLIRRETRMGIAEEKREARQRANQAQRQAQQTRPPFVPPMMAQHSPSPAPLDAWGQPTAVNPWGPPPMNPAAGASSAIPDFLNSILPQFELPPMPAQDDAGDDDDADDDSDSDFNDAGDDADDTEFDSENDDDNEEAA